MQVEKDVKEWIVAYFYEATRQFTRLTNLCGPCMLSVYVNRFYHLCCVFPSKMQKYVDFKIRTVVFVSQIFSSADNNYIVQVF